MSEHPENLQLASAIVLVRCPNGWVAERCDVPSLSRETRYAFESTESLAKQLVRLIGKSEWKIETAKRDAKGHFVPAPKQP